MSFGNLDAARSEQYCFHMADQPKREIRYCRACGAELTSWKSPYCSDQCYELGPSENPPVPKPVSIESAEEPKAAVPKRCVVCDKPLDAKHRKYCSAACYQKANPQPVQATSIEPEGQPKQPAGTEPKVKRKIGRPTKATPERIEAVLADMARGFNREQACAHNGCSHDQWQEWEKRPEFPTLRHRAEAQRINYLINAIEAAVRSKLDWRAYWVQLERLKAYRDQFGDPAKVFALPLSNNGFAYTPTPEAQAEIDAQRQRCRAMIEDKDEWSPPARDIEVQVEHEPLVVKNQRMPEPTLEEEPNSRPQQPGPHSMRASDMDPLSGTAKPAKRQEDRFTEQRERWGGAGKHPF